MEKIQMRTARFLCRDDIETHRAVYIFITGPSAENKRLWGIQPQMKKLSHFPQGSRSIIERER